MSLTHELVACLLRRPCSILWLVLAFCAGCAGHQVPHIARDESQPHISWEIRAGGKEGDDRPICGSSQGTQNCVLDASAERSPNRATVRLFLHPAARETVYLGFMRLPFLQGGALVKSGEIKATVRSGSVPVGSTVNAITTSDRGGYTLEISVDAMQEGWSTPQRITEEIPVSVR